MSVDPILWAMTPNELVAYDNSKHLSLSPYVYVRNNPILYIDPDGFTDWKAFAKGAGRSTLGLVGVVASGAGIVGSAALAPKTLGASLVGVKASTVGLTLSGTEVGIGISDMRVALNTPDGMSAEQFNTVLGLVAEQAGMSETSQKTINLANTVLSGGGLLKVGKLFADDKVIQGTAQGVQLTSDAVGLIKTAVQEQLQRQQQEQDKEKSEGQ